MATTMEQRTISVRDGMFEAEVFEWGSTKGEPLLFLHGSSSLVRGPYLEDLGDRYHVIAPTHPGFGESTGLDHIDDPVDMAIYYYDFLDALGIDAAHVVGHSLGGMLAAEVAALDPHRVRKLVLCNPVGLWRDDAPVLDFFAEDIDRLQRAVWYDTEGEQAKAMRPDMSDMEKLMAFMYESMQSLAAAGKFLWPIPDRGLAKRLHRIAAPTLIVWGAADQLVPAVYAEEFRSRIRDARVAILPKSAHFPMLEEREDWVRAVTDFLG
ncbi:MAG: alpha/beta hydrolase [Dehalococcoidia bacterium]